MPSTVQVKVNAVNHTTQLSKAGKDLNYCEITGFDAAAGKGFKKRFFATKQDGTATKNAETADSLSQNDWIEVVMDDSSYKNVQTIKRINEPAGMTAPDQSGAGGSTGPAQQVNKEHWDKAAGKVTKTPKAFRSVGQLNREKALDAALFYLKIRGPAEGIDNVNATLDVARRFEDYLVTDIPEVNGEIRGGGSRNTVLSAEESQAMLDKEAAEASQANANVNTPAPQDDDIPF